jgi:hypothetical protein
MHPLKEQRREKARKALNARNIEFESFNDDLHWKIGNIDFYPTSGYWDDRSNGQTGHGHESLIKYIKPKIMDGSVIKKSQLTIEQIFQIAIRSKDKSLTGICTEIHKAIYKETK